MPAPQVAATTSAFAANSAGVLTPDIALSVVAIALSVLAMLFEVLFYFSQTKLNREMMKENAAFNADMKHLLGKLEGLATATQGSVAEQQKQMLHALIGRFEPAAENAFNEEISGQLGQLKTSLEEVAGKARLGEESAMAMNGVMDRISELQSSVPDIAARVAREMMRTEGSHPWPVILDGGRDLAPGVLNLDRPDVLDLLLADLDLGNHLVLTDDQGPAAVRDPGDHWTSKRRADLQKLGLVTRTLDSRYETTPLGQEAASFLRSEGRFRQYLRKRHEGSGPGVSIDEQA
jgi:hypothetical protein